MEQEKVEYREFPESDDYITMAQAAENLSARIKDEVNEKEVPSIALDDVLKLSVKLPNYTPAKHFNHDDTRKLSIEINNYFSEIKLLGDENIVLIKGYLDLCLEGGGGNEIEYILKYLSLGYPTKKNTLMHRYIYVENATNGQKYQLQEYVDPDRYPQHKLLLNQYQYGESDIWRPTESLPNKYGIRVRKSALDELDDLKVKNAIEKVRKEQQANEKLRKEKQANDNAIFRESVRKREEEIAPNPNGTQAKL